ncbi:helix-turn-helix transcriptional regulator [Clostridium omnivorum]|uniref:Transcriptional regulator n=1 Tax=Clostridium omnivorum TaxID=1604902 RepID=A0ABQ5N573_9CLOT|nr:YafY family protein [Clostridium sp. E14]GLC30316.1 transcriptional regulator [Clostridium sp. E14]
MQINRLFEIVYLLLYKKRTTAKELAEHFEVSVRTILRDIETLSAAGIPIYSLQGKGGGISILDNYILNKTTISDNEQNQILFALQSMSSTNHIDVSDVLSKLCILFNKTGNSWIEVDFSSWTNWKPDKERFETLKDAVIGKQAVSFTYLSSQGDITHRTAYPLKLIFKVKSWYMQGYDLLKQDYRTFKIIRMQDIRILSKNFADKQFHLPPIEIPTNTSYSLTHLKLRVAHQAAYRIYDEFNQKHILQDEDGSLLVSISLPEDDWLYGFLLSFGTSVEILEPLYVKEKLLHKIDEIKKFHTQSIT